MLKQLKSIYRDEKELILGGLLTFLISFAIYLKTIAPSVSFWDCGEFIASSYILGVPHPPGAPFYIILSRFFTMIPLFSDLAARVNIISALSTAFTILLTYLIIGQLGRSINGRPDNRFDKVILYSAAMIGALCFAFSDTVWFNAVEAEVYALSMLFTALVLWLALKWFESRKELSSLRFMLIIMYIFGLGFGVHLLNLLMAPTILLLILFYQPELFKKWQFWSIVPVVAILGATTYFMIYIRAGMAPSINENDPSNLANFWYYFSRQQYGSKSLFMTLFDREAPFWDYQVNFMYTRYFGWNFIGKGTTYANMNRGFLAETIALNGLKGMPFLLGIIGMVYHWAKDWRKALAIMCLFILTGIGIVIYLNQPDPQPRERDYVYIGSFFAFALWVGLGAFAILKFIKKWLEQGILQKIGVGLIAGVLVIIGPVNQFQFNYKSHDRSGNYIPWDYAYNILISLDKDAILFTHGDNDTFPVWYLQEVEGIRKDVKVINLSLLNTIWYISQIKHYEPKIDFNVSDEQILNLRPVQFEGQEAAFRIPVKFIKDHYNEYGKTAPEEALKDPTVRFRVEPTMTVGDIKGLRLQDQMIIQIVATQMGKRPIYFAITIDPKSFVGLRPYFRLDGLNFKLTPVKNPEINAELLHKIVFEDYQFRAINNPDVHLDFGTRRILNNYRNAFMTLAQYYYNTGKREELAPLLDRMLDVLPESRQNFKDMVLTENIGKLYWFGGRNEEFQKRIKDMLSWKPDIPGKKREEFADLLASLFQDHETATQAYEKLLNKNPGNSKYLSRLVRYYEAGEMKDKAIEVLEVWMEKNPDDNEVRVKLESLKDSVSAEK